jgi:hypothetical protein
MGYLWSVKVKKHIVANNEYAMLFGKPWVDYGM